MRELLFRFYPKSNFGQYRLTVSRYHLLFLLKFILWLAIGILTGSSLSYIYTHYQYEHLSLSPCVPTYWLHSHKHQQHGDLVKRHLVKILVIHISEESRSVFKLKHQIWRQQAGSKLAALNHVLHFVDQDLYQQDGEDNQHNDQEWLVPLKGLSNATFMQGFKMIIYHLLTSFNLTHEFYCFTTNNVQLDHRRLQHLLNSVYFGQPLSVKKGNKKEQIQNPGCLLASNCTPADGLILSRSVLENASAIIEACMLSDFGTFLNFENRFNECITSTLFECVESPKVSLLLLNFLSLKLMAYFCFGSMLNFFKKIVIKKVKLSFQILDINDTCLENLKNSQF